MIFNISSLIFNQSFIVLQWSFITKYWFGYNSWLYKLLVNMVYDDQAPNDVLNLLYILKLDRCLPAVLIKLNFLAAFRFY